MFKKPKPHHRPVLTKAWQMTIQHKELWLFGIFAMLLNSGGVVNITFRAFKRATGEGTVRELVEGSIPGSGTIITYFQELAVVGAGRIVVTTIILTLLLALLIYVGLVAQTSLISNLHNLRGKKKVRLTQTFRHTTKKLLQILGVDLLARLAMTGVLLISSGLFLTLSTTNVAAGVIANIAILLVLVPASLLIGYLSIFALVEVVVADKGVFHAIEDAWIVLQKNWVAVTELALILFLVNLAVTILTIGTILLFLVPFLLVFVGALFTGVSALWIGTIALGTICITVIVLAYGGLLTTFTYATWYQLYKKLGQKKRFRSKLDRLLLHLSKKK